MNTTVKKALRITTKILTWLLIAFTVFMMIFTVFTVTTVDKNERDIFGYRFYIVLTDSMSESELNKDMDVHFDAGDIVIIESLSDKEKYNLQPGDIISFISFNPDSTGETITHMIRERKYEGEEFIGYVTFGTNTDTNDEAVVEPDYVLGRHSATIPYVGSFLNFIKTTPGYIVCILIPFLLLICYNGANVIIIFRRYKKEQRAIIDAERAEIAAERKQNEDLLRELQALRDQMTGGAAPTAPPAAPRADEEAPAEPAPAADEEAPAADAPAADAPAPEAPAAETPEDPKDQA